MRLGRLERGRSIGDGGSILVLRQAQDEDFYCTVVEFVLILSLSKDEDASGRWPSWRRTSNDFNAYRSDQRTGQPCPCGGNPSVRRRGGGVARQRANSLHRQLNQGFPPQGRE
uniref:Uncharacterized protein n=1 Tax=Caulobacter sp. (strain K31) TaxID=366602 RepID=B0SUM3_CAUSK